MKTNLFVLALAFNIASIVFAQASGDAPGALGGAKPPAQGSEAAAYSLRAFPAKGNGDVRLYGIRKGQRFVQTNSTEVISPDGYDVFCFDATIVTEGASAISGISVTAPNGTNQSSFSYYSNHWALTPTYTSKEALETNYPNGAYTLAWTSSQGSNVTVTLNLSGDAYPSTPRVSNYATAQAIDGRADFTLRWDAFTGGTVNDYIQVIVGSIETNGMQLQSEVGDIFRTPEFGQPGALGGTATSVVIPRNTIYAQESLWAALMFIKRVSFDDHSCPGAVGGAGYYKITALGLHASNGPVGPDLVPTSLAWSGSPQVGETLPITVRARNQGDVSARAGWSYAFYLSSTNVWDASATRLTATPSAVESQALAPGATVTNTFYVTIEGTPAASGCFLIMRLNDSSAWWDSGQLRETIKTNNSLAAPITISYPDLAAMSLSWNGVAEPKSWIDVSWAVTNVGVRPVPALSSGWSDGVYLSTNATGQGGWQLGNSPVDYDPYEALAPGEGYVQTSSLSLPDVAPGNYYLCLRVDVDQAVTESNRTNNTLVRPITLTTSASLADLAPARVAACATGVPGQPLQVVCVVTNQGAVAAGVPWSDQLVLSTNAAWDAHDLVLVSRTQTQAVAAGSSYTFTNSVTLPPWRAGTYYLVLKTDSGGTLNESSETNNTLATPVLCHTIKFVGAQLLANGAVQVGIEALVGTNYTLLTSKDLVHWTRLLDFTCTNSPMLVRDVNGGGVGRRFYRAAPLATNASLCFAVASPGPWTSNGLELVLDGPLGKNIQIEASTNLAYWSVITNLSSCVVPLRFTDPGSTVYKRRFYRAVAP